MHVALLEDPSGQQFMVHLGQLIRLQVLIIFLQLNEFQVAHVCRDSSVEVEAAPDPTRFRWLVVSVSHCCLASTVAKYMPFWQEWLSRSPYSSMRYWVLAVISENV